ncbi:hypothetical protein [Microbacterium immunditiarum]|uniref:Uncharacterized protein n=1 Tax=Microbacterium immunditiarum TaxID=337480 RepID=A0A7Y9GQN3_9MICO|nr:hypothetical protein [Microbacterium immunditiarum]NYE20910.1 hypothetical protein [Microbacterium immunditiarum]
MELIVRGRLSPELILTLDGFDVMTDERGFTRITGPVADQSRLLGVLELFDGLHIEVVSVNPVESAPASGDDGGPPDAQP